MKISNMIYLHLYISFQKSTEWFKFEILNKNPIHQYLYPPKIVTRFLKSFISFQVDTATCLLVLNLPEAPVSSSQIRMITFVDYNAVGHFRNVTKFNA